jgi:hypothetical protein
MTPKEHLLMLTLFAKQMQLIKILFDVMDRHGLRMADDIPAFEFGENIDAESRIDILIDTWEKYVGLAKHLEVVTGLESHPPPSTGS